MLYLGGRNKAEREAFLNEVTASLKTYTTKSSNPDLSVLIPMADVLSRARPAKGDGDGEE
jgi:hypothetical protein